MKLHRLSFVALLGLTAAMGCGDSDTAKNVDAAAPDTGPPKPQCSDGIDNDGDGRVDYPSDPGCSVPQQDSETDDCPSGSGCPQCANGIDDDANGKTDYPDDPGCSSAGDFDEYTLNPGACGSAVTIHQLPVTGIATGTMDATQLYGQISTCGGGSSGMIVVAAYELHLTSPKVIVATTTGSAVDTVLDLRGADCQADTSELACDDNSVGLQSKITYSAQPGTYYLLVEAKTASDVGMYKLTVEQLAGEGEGCLDTSECGPGLVCRIPHGSTTMSCEQPVCNDGRDDDEDGKMDYPADPGCATPDDSDETDDCPSGPNCPACSNGLDDDNDGQTDYPTDTSCSSAAGGSEACQGEQDPILAIVSPTTPNNMTGAHDDHSPTCGLSGGLDEIFTIKIPAMRSLTIDTDGTAFDTVLSLLTATCAEPSLACDDQGGSTTNASRITRSNLTAGTYIVAVDAYEASTTLNGGDYAVNVSGVIAPGGACNPADTLGGALACPASNPCVGATGSMICQPSACGDGLDNDSDGHTDFPEDPGCSSIDDTDESDSCPGAGPNCPECADGVDNDGDGQTDYPNDTNCSYPGQASEGCATTDGVTDITTGTIDVDTSGANDDVMVDCAYDTGGLDRTLGLQVPALKNLTINSDSDFTPAIALYNSTCGGTALRCETYDDTISKNNVPAGNYFIVVDSAYGDESGTSTLTISGVIQNGASCEGALAQAGVFTCDTGFACTGTPGSRTCRPAACNDGLDNDGDGIADYPNDPGCSSESDSDESDDCPTGPNCPACANGIDDDGDGLIDYPDDSACISSGATSESCRTSDPLVPLVLPVTAGTTVGATNDSTPDCQTFDHTAGDRTYSITVPALTSLTITNDDDFDGVISLYDSTCGGDALSCSDFDEGAEMTNVAAGTYYYVVDGYEGSEGAYTITVAGTIANGASCESPLAISGALTCGPGYGCGGTMGARTCMPSQCRDGIDNDGDGKTDFPLDPGCESADDADETDPATPPVCANGADDDTDTLIDYPADFGCSGAGSTSEAFCTTETDATAMITANPTTGDTTGMTDDFSSQSCQSSADGPDAVLGLQLPVKVASLTLDLSNSSYDTVISMRDAACGTEVGCDDDSGEPGNQSKLTMTDVPAGNYSVVIDGWNGSEGTWTLDVTGVVASGTRCDSALFTAGILACDAGLTCTGSPATCQ
jgi:hypothetical protein